MFSLKTEKRNTKNLNISTPLICVLSSFNWINSFLRTNGPLPRHWVVHRKSVMLIFVTFSWDSQE